MTTTRPLTAAERGKAKHMRNGGPFIQGQQAADAGLPYTACPHGKPDIPDQGEDYPGDWCNWMAGWINRRSMKASPADDADLRAACELSQSVTWPWPGRKPGEPL